MLEDTGVADAPPIGHNSPPPPTPFEAHQRDVLDLYDEAKNWLDGVPIENQRQADDVQLLLDKARKAKTAADNQRKVEKKPHDDAAKAVDELWKPLTSKCELIVTASRNVLTPWLAKVEEEKRAAAEAARLEAERKAAEAEAARFTADRGDLESVEEAEALTQAAKRAAADAARADKDRAQAKGAGSSRAVGLRTVYRPELVDPAAALKFYRERRPAELKEWLLSQAQADVRVGLRNLPGFQIHEERTAV